MQDNKFELKSINPSLKAIDYIKHDLDKFGYCTEKTKQQIIDEEKTHAAEIVAAFCYGTDIPRDYRLNGDDLVDEHGVSLRRVLDGGIDFLKLEENKKAGWSWELNRRKIERSNLASIVAMPVGVACVEISSTDQLRPESELKNWGYAGSSFARITYRHNNDQFMQRNIMLDTSDLRILNELRKTIEVSSEDCANSEELLANPQFVCVDKLSFEILSAKINNFNKNLQIEHNPPKYLLSIIRQAKKTRENSWEFVKEHDIFNELLNEFMSLAATTSISESEINTMRAGAWQVMIDELSNDKSKESLGSSIHQGVSKARAIGAVFTSCGGTVSLQNFSSIQEGSFYDRYSVASMLVNRISGMGFCKSCGVSSIMYGCGVYCRSCNSAWCEEYIYRGIQLSDKEVFNKVYGSYFRR